MTESAPQAAQPVRTPKHLDLIYDVGLHTGADAEYYLRKGFRVVAFEANAELVAACRVRLKTWLDNGSLTIVEGAIISPEAMANGQTTVRFYTHAQKDDWGTVLTDWSDRNERLGAARSITEVAAVNFTDAIRQHGIPHFLKVDIEGCDTICVEALREFEERPTYISIESDKTSFGNIVREISLLAGLGYSSFQAVEQSEVDLSEPPALAREGKYAAYRFESGHSSGLFGSELKGKWKSRQDILRQYRFIRLGYFLLGDDGIMNKWTFRGSIRLRSLAREAIRHFTGGIVPGWYDTHARHRGAN